MDSRRSTSSRRRARLSSRPAATARARCARWWRAPGAAPSTSRKNTARSGTRAALRARNPDTRAALAFRHRPHVGERSAVAAQIFVDRHRSLPSTEGAAERPRLRRLTCPATSASRRHPHVLDRSGRARHDVEVEDLGRQPQRRARVRDVDHARDVALARRGAEDRVGLRARVAELGQILDRVEAGLPIGDVDVEIVLLALLVDRDAFEDQVVVVGRRDRATA